jgi:hypothetical protein
MIKDKRELELANSQLNRERNEMSTRIVDMETELNFLRRSNEEHLDQFDSKFDDIKTEISKLKNENISLKDKEKLSKRKQKDLEEENEHLT